jgi:gliding motility-associated lipoprotein GldH
MPNRAIYFLIVLLTVIATGCDRNRVFEKNLRIPDAEWINTNVPYFNVTISDTATAHNIYVNVRNSGKYRYSNLYLFITTKAPNGNILRDTLDVILANDRGKWLGKGIGDIYFNQVPYKRNIRFPYRGIYTFEIEQAMREDTLSGIMDVGLRVEKAGKSR